MKVNLYFVGLITLISSGFASAEAISNSHKKINNAEKAYAADQFVRLGIEEKEPLYVLAAANLYKDILDETNMVESQQIINGLTKLALDMSKGDSAISKLGDGIVVAKRRNIIANVKRKVGNISRGEKVAFIAEFEGGVDATASLILDPSAISNIRSRSNIEVDFIIRDSAGREVCTLQSSLMPYRCAWTPSTQDKYKIELVNSGQVDIPYVLYFD